MTRDELRAFLEDIIRRAQAQLRELDGPGPRGRAPLVEIVPTRTSAMARTGTDG